MTKFLSAVIGVFAIIGVIAWTLIAVLGGAEILWWIFTGDFFHFVNTCVEVAGTIW